MSEISLLSTRSSSLYASSIAGSAPDDSQYVYSMDKSKINLFKDKMVRVPINGVAPDSESMVELPSFGILTRMVLKTTISYKKPDDVSPTPTHAMYARLINQVSLNNSSRQIQTIHGDMIQYIVQNMPKDERTKWQIMGRNDIRYATATQFPEFNVANNNDVRKVDVYTILPFSCFKEGGAGKNDHKLNYNLRFLEKLSCNIRWNKVEEVLPNMNEVTYSAELLCDYAIINEKSLDSIESKNYSLSSPLAQVYSNWALTNAVVNCRADTTAQHGVVNLFNTQLLHSLVFTIKKVRAPAAIRTLYATMAAAAITANTGAGNAGTSNTPKALKSYHGSTHHTSIPGADFIHLSDGQDYSVRLVSAGRVLYEAKTNMEALLLGSLDENMGSCWVPQTLNDFNDVAGCSPHNFYVIPFADDSRRTHAIRGCLATKNLNSLQLQVYFPASGGNDYEISVYCRYYFASSTNSNSGRIQISLSS